MTSTLLLQQGILNDNHDVGGDTDSYVMENIHASFCEIIDSELFRFANKLRSAGRLLELVVIPGSRHASEFLISCTF